MYKYPFYLLKKRRFLPFFVTQFFGALNDNVFKLSVLTLIAFHLTTDPSENQFYQALGAGLFSLPFFLFSATAGQLADKYSKTFLMRWIKCIEVILMIIGSTMIYAESISGMLAIILLMGIHSAFFGPLKYAILPEHLKRKEWLAGTAFVEAGTFMAILIGVLLGTLLIPENSAFLENGLLFSSLAVIAIAVCGAISSFFIPSAKPANPELKIGLNIFGAMRSIMAESKKLPFVFPAIIGISWFWFVGASFLTEFPAYVQYTLGAEKNVFTLFLALFTIGVAIGTLLSNRWLKGKISARHIFLAILGMSVFTIDVYFQSPVESSVLPENAIAMSVFLSHFYGFRITLDFFLLAICGGIYIVPLYALIQKYSPVEWRSRMIAANNIMNALFMLFSAVWIGALASWNVSIATIFLSLALFNIVFAVYLLKLTPKSFLQTMIAFKLRCLYRVEVKGIKNYKIAQENSNNAENSKNKKNKPCFILINYTSLIDCFLLAAFLPCSKKNPLNIIIEDLAVLGSIFERYLQIMLKLLPVKIYKTLDVCQLPIDGFSILPIQIKGALFLPFSNMKGKVPKKWFPKIKIVVQMTLAFQAKNIESTLIQKTNELMFASLDWKHSVFDSLIAMYNVHGKRVIAGDIQQEKISYADIVMRSFILGDLMAKNTQKGEYVGILLPTMINSMICFFGLQAFGRIPAMLNFSIGSRRLKATCVLANVKTVYTSHAFIAQAKMEELIEALLELNIKMIYLEDYRKTMTGFDKIKGFLRGYFSRWFVLHEKINSKDPAVILFTSGSEGLPKGVVLSHRNLLANTAQMSTRINFATNDFLFNALPIFHCFGLTAGMLLPIMHGFSVFFYPSPLHYRLIPEWVGKTKATIFLATDTFLKGYAHYANLENFDTVRCVFAGAEKVKEETIKKWEGSLNTFIFEGYGVTEAAPVIAVNNAQQRKIGSVGCLMPKIQYRLEAFENLDLKQGGRLWISGPNVMLGYLQADNPNVIVPLTDGWYDTGDIASVDEEGYLTLLGRARRFAKIGGEMVSFSVVENAIATLWPQHLHAVLSVVDDKKGEQLVLLTDCPEAKREALVHCMNTHGYSELFIPKKIQVLSEIPVLGTGKIDYAALEKYVENMRYAAEAEMSLS